MRLFSLEKLKFCHSHWLEITESNYFLIVFVFLHNFIFSFPLRNSTTTGTPMTRFTSSMEKSFWARGKIPSNRNSKKKTNINFEKYFGIIFWVSQKLETYGRVETIKPVEKKKFLPLDSSEFYRKIKKWQKLNFKKISRPLKM